jgi:hypothetical protein
MQQKDTNKKDTAAKTLSDREYKALSDLYHNFPEAFFTVSSSIRDLYYSRVYQKG